MFLMIRLVPSVDPLDQCRRFPRIGVRFADGRTAGSGSRLLAPLDVDVAKDDSGISTEPILRMGGGGGGVGWPSLRCLGVSPSHPADHSGCTCHFPPLVTPSPRLSSTVPPYAELPSGVTLALSSR
jgi:hypothetical protein